MVLTTEEKACVVCLTLELMNADYRITQNEVNFYALMQKYFSLTDSDFQNGKAMDPYNALNILKNMPNEKKALIGLVFRKLISVDGQPNNPTINVLNVITIKTDLARAIKTELEKFKSSQQ